MNERVDHAKHVDLRVDPDQYVTMRYEYAYLLNALDVALIERDAYRDCYHEALRVLHDEK